MPNKVCLYDPLPVLQGHYDNRKPPQTSDTGRGETYAESIQGQESRLMLRHTSHEGLLTVAEFDFLRRVYRGKEGIDKVTLRG